MPVPFLFVNQDGRSQVSPGQRALIRSQCMHGRNKRATSRRSTRESARAGQLGSPPECEKVSTGSRSVENDADHTEASLAENLDAACTIRCPVKPERSSFRFTALADEVGAESEELMSNVMAYSAFRNATYPIELCVSFHKTESGHIPWLFVSKAFLHSVLFALSAMHDFALRRPATKRTIRCLRNTIVHLNEQLACHRSRYSDATLWTVISLAMLATLLGDDSAAAAHLDGLRSIVALRGGSAFLLTEPKKHYKLSSLDLNWYAHSGKDLYFSDSSCSWNSVFLGPRPKQDGLGHPALLPKHADPKLITVFTDLQRLSSLLNVACETGRPLEASSFQHWLLSIQSRLVKLRVAEDDGVSESVRLGMIAYLSATFRLPSGRVPLNHLAAEFRRTLSISMQTAELDVALRLWLLIVGTMSVFEVGEEWIRSAWKACTWEDGSWELLRERLEFVMWISCVHDHPGRQAFVALQRGSLRSSFTEEASERP